MNLHLEAGVGCYQDDPYSRCREDGYQIMDTTKTAPQSVSSNPTIANQNNIQWAAVPGTVKTVSLEEQFEAAKARNWISERMISQSQRHWHCTREQAIERLLAQHKK
jgi:hypothetical protein